MPKGLLKNRSKGLLKAIKSFTVEETERVIREMAEELGTKAGILINGVRTVVTGQAVGPGLFDVLVTVGQSRVVDRLRKAGAFFG